MRIATVLLWLCLLCGGGAQASVGLSPVLVEEEQVYLGQEMVVTIFNLSHQTTHFGLSLAGFNQSLDGSLRIDQREVTVNRANQLLELSDEELDIGGGQSKQVKVIVSEEPSPAGYFLLVIEGTFNHGVSRFLVPLLLATKQAISSVEILDATLVDNNLVIEIKNRGDAHGAYQGDLVFRDSGGNVLATQSWTSGRILPNRIRHFNLEAPANTYTVDFSEGGVWVVGTN